MNTRESTTSFSSIVKRNMNSMNDAYVSACFIYCCMIITYRKDSHADIYWCPPGWQQCAQPAVPQSHLVVQHRGPQCSLLTSCRGDDVCLEAPLQLLDQPMAGSLHFHLCMPCQAQLQLQAFSGAGFDAVVPCCLSAHLFRENTSKKM